MAIDKLKKIIFTLICIVLVASIGVVAYATWDNVTGKKTGDLGVNTGDKTILTCTSSDNTTVAGKQLVPFGTQYYRSGTSSGVAVNFFSWKVVPKLNDITKKDSAGNLLTIKYSALTVTVKNASGTIVASSTPTGAQVNSNTIYTYWLSATAPPALPGTEGAVVPVAPLTFGTVMPSENVYYFVIRFKNTVSTSNTPYVNCTIDIAIDLVANGQ